MLRELERLKLEFGEEAARRKLALVRALGRATLDSAGQVLRLHELLCFLRAYPDDARLLQEVERRLETFAGRRDLKRFGEALADTGIAGTPIRYEFFAATASWLARRWGDRLTIDWDAVDEETGRALEKLLPLLAHYAETPGLDELDLGTRGWYSRMAGPRSTDASLLVGGIGAIDADDPVRQLLFERLGVSLRLAPGPGTPSRTLARYETAEIGYQRGPFERGRPDLAGALSARPRWVRSLSAAEGRRIVDLAREAMVTRSRDLDVFAYGDPRDVRLVDWGGGLQFACIGARPDRRLLLESVYGLLTLKNGVPVGYVLISALFQSSEIAYNVFETFRGAEAAAIYARVLATARHLFGSDSFTIFPYQLGENNDEALQSGAWWFYYKLGFRPKHAGVLRLARGEEARIRQRAAYRSSIATLRRLAGQSLYWHLGRPREDVIGLFPLAAVGLAVTDYLAGRFGADRAEGARACTSEAAALLGLRSLATLERDERLWFSRWAPLVSILPGVERWSRAERRALVDVIRAKGGRRESDYVRRLDRHRKLRRALVQLVS